MLQDDIKCFKEVINLMEMVEDYIQEHDKHTETSKEVIINMIETVDRNN